MGEPWIDHARPDGLSAIAGWAMGGEAGPQGVPACGGASLLADVRRFWIAQRLLISVGRHRQVRAASRPRRKWRVKRGVQCVARPNGIKRLGTV